MDSEKNGSSQPEFGKIRAVLWPIHKFELKKFLPMSLLILFILFVYTFVRDLKDVFVQYHTNLWVDADKTASAQLISALKIWYVLPITFFVVMIFSKLVDKFGSKKTFYIIVTSYIIFYAAFGFLLYPNLNILSMSSEQITSMVDKAPHFFKTFLTCFGNWPISLFYIFSEIWGSLAIGSLFWQFANATTMKNEVTRFFGLFYFLGNIGTFFAGLTLKKALHDASINNVRNMMLSVMVVGVLVLATYAYINNNVLTDKRFFDLSQIKTKKKKVKVSIMEGIKILFSNSYMLLIAALIICYGMSSNLSEALLKAEMKSFYSAEGYKNMQGNLSMFTGIFTIFVTLFGSNILRRCKWKTSALITPLMFLAPGIIFFAFVLYNEFISKEIFGFSTLCVAVWCGIIQDALSKSIKYALFDSTKNMAYLPLDEDTKTKGQAAVEVIGGRLGKGGGALVQQIMFAGGSGIIEHAVAIIFIFVAMIFTWIGSVFSLNKKYEKAIEKQD